MENMERDNIRDSRKYVSLNRLSDFLDNLKSFFAKKTELDSLESVMTVKTSPAGDSFGTVMSGGDVEIKNGIITVQDDSHNHLIDNVTGLHDALVSKAEVDHTHNEMYYTKTESDAKVSDINTSISNITNGNTVVSKANEAINAEFAQNAKNSEMAAQDNNGNIIINTYETKTDASSKLSEAKSYADGVKNDLLNGAGEAYDTLKELADLIDDNTDAIDALEIVASGKADKVHTHIVSDVTGLQDALDSKSTKSEFNAHVGEFNSHKEEFNTHKGEFNALSDNYNSHASNKNNPHEVTTSQIGAMAVSDYDSTSEIKEAGGIVDWANSQYEKKVDGVVASSLSIGSSVFLNVNGELTEWLVVHQGNPDANLYDNSCNGTWLLMKDSYVQYMPFDSEPNNIYSESDIHSYLNNDFYNLLDSDTRAVVKQVKIPYVSDDNYEVVSSGINGLSTKVFILSAREIGNSDDNVLIDGATLSYFEGGSNDLRIAKYKGQDSWWWTRTSVGSSSGAAYENYVIGVFGDGAFSYSAYGASDDVRPAMIISSSTIINPETGEAKMISGDMNSSDYDPTGEIISAGGIINWFNANGGSNGGTSGQLASDLKIGSSVFFNVNGIPTEFIVVHQGNPDTDLYDGSCDGTWFMAKNIYEKKSMSTVYTSSDAHDYLNGTFFNMLDYDIRTNIKQIKLPYTEWTTVHTGENGISTRIFIPSRSEINFGYIYDDVVDGATLSYFSGATDSFRIANYNGSAEAWWTRTAYTQSPSNAHSVSASGTWGGSDVSKTFGVRPMFILPSDYDFSASNGTTEETTFNGYLISSLPIGKSVTFNVGGKSTEFIVVQQGNPDSSIYDSSCNGTWFMAKDIYCKSKYNSIATNASSSYYDESDIHNYLSGTFLNLLDENLRLNIVQAKIPYVNHDGVLKEYYGADGMLASVFILDAQEMGYDPDAYSLQDYRGKAAVLDYFEGATDSTRIANYDGSPTIYWTRSYNTKQEDDYSGEHDPHVFRIFDSGTFSSWSVSDTHGVRPVFILPSAMYLDIDTGVIAESAGGNSGSSGSTGTGSGSDGGNSGSSGSTGSGSGDATKLASSLEVGSSVFFDVNGVPTEFLVIQQGNPNSSIYPSSCDGTWFLMKDCYTEMFYEPEGSSYGTSDISKYLNNDFYNLLEENVRLNIKNATIPFVKENTVYTGTTGLTTKVFLLSLTEANLRNYGDGAVLSYFTPNTDTIRAAFYNGEECEWFTRTDIEDDDTGMTYTVLFTDGDWNSWGHGSIYSPYGVRPAFILPSDYDFAANDSGDAESGENSGSNTETVSGKILSSIPVGSTVNFNVDGVPTEFIVVQQGNPSTSMYDSSCDGTWFMAKDIYSKSKMSSVYYGISTVHDYLNGTFFNLLDSNLRPYIKQVKIPTMESTSTSNKGSNGEPTRIFILSAHEIDLSISYTAKDGAILSYFEGATDSFRIAKYGETNTAWWTRTLNTTSNMHAVSASTGASTSTAVTSSIGVRPVFILPSDMYIDVDTGLVQDAQDYVGGNGSSVLPQYTSEDEGKILCILNGTPTWVSISTLT